MSNSFQFPCDKTKNLAALISSNLLDLFLAKSLETFQLGVEKGLGSLKSFQEDRNVYGVYLKLQSLYDRFKEEGFSHNLLTSLYESCRIWGISLKLTEADFRDLEIIHEFEADAKRRYREKIKDIIEEKEKCLFRNWGETALAELFYEGPFPEDLESVMGPLNDPPVPENLNLKIVHTGDYTADYAPIKQYTDTAYERDEKIRKTIYGEK